MKAKKVALIYPGESFMKISGNYLDPVSRKQLDKEGSVITLSVDRRIKEWQKNISTEISSWIKLN